MKQRFLQKWHVLLGLFCVATVGESARATSLIYGKLSKNATASPDEVPTGPALAVDGGNVTAASNVTKLTGIPQLDYIHDPNLPRELNGHNLTDYPFYNGIPPEIDFKCDGLHDGFYASVAHHCQVYHHCLFGTRYDFLCANYTAFDQKNFICHFASEVDCKNSPKFFKRNEALYKSGSTTTVAPPTTAKPLLTDSSPGRKRRPSSRRRKPTYDYYDDYDDYQDDYEDRRSKKTKPQSKEPGLSEPAEPLPTGPNKALFDRPRVAPKIRRPVPNNERDKYDYNADSRIIPTKDEPLKEDEEKTDNGKRNNKSKSDEQEGGRQKERDRDRQRERNRYRDRDEDDRGRIRDDEDRRLRDDEVRVRDRPRDSGRDDDRIRGLDEDDRLRDRPYRDERRDDGRTRDRVRDDGRVRGRDEDGKIRERPLRDPDLDDRGRDRLRDSDRGRDTPRRRPGKRRKRPEYDYYEDEDYEEERRPSTRDRWRYDDDDEDDYDDPRYNRKPVRQRERDRYRKNEDVRRPRPKDNDRPSSNDYEEDDEDRPISSKEVEKPRSDSRIKELEDARDDVPARKQKESSTSTSRERQSEESFKSSQERQRILEADSTQASGEITSEKMSSKESTVPSKKPSYTRKTTFVRTTERQTLPTEAPARNPPVQDAQPKTTTSAPRKQNARKSSTERYSDEDMSRESYSMEASRERQMEPQRNTPKRRGPNRGDANQSRPTSQEVPALAPPSDRPTLKVPLDDTDDELLAPRAPKTTSMSSKRRPFLPSRGGDPELLRGLTPVGNKAADVPKGQPQVTVQSKLPSGNKLDASKFPTGIEFRTRVRANLGVEQPQLQTEEEEDYSGEVTDSGEDVSNRRPGNLGINQGSSGPVRTTFDVQDAGYNPRNTYTTDRTPTPLRPTLKSNDFVPVNASIEKVAAPFNSESRERKYSSKVQGSIQPTPVSALSLQEQHEPRLPIQNHFGPQTFFSENPKFQTALSNIDSSRPRPTASNYNYNQATHVPQFYQPLVKPGQGQVQVVHFGKSPADYQNQQNRKAPPPVRFPQQPDNLEDTDEYDVSFNDALTPISTLQPRNTQAVAVQKTAGSSQVRRRLLPANPTYQSYILSDPRITSQKQVIPRMETISQPQYIQGQSPVLRTFRNDFYPTYVR